MDFITPTNILFLITIGTVFVNIYLSVKKPQIDLEKEDIKTKSKTDTLLQQVEWEREATVKRFKEIQDNFYKILEVNQNHLHTLESKLETHITNSLEDTKTLTRIETLLTQHIK